jgi:Ca2+-binding RTX toxin-like protein
MMTMPVFALYNLNDAGTTAADGVVGDGAQNGVYLNGADSDGSQEIFDGVNDIVKIYPNDSFQMDRGTLAIDFTLSCDPLDGTQTVLSRDSAGQTEGGYHIDILASGAVVISHETATGTQTFGTATGFASPGDRISLSYSWDQGGAGGTLVITNVSDGTSFNADVPATLTMDMGVVNQPWIIGAGQSLPIPLLNGGINQNFSGSVTTFSLSDSVDNTVMAEERDADAEHFDDAEHDTYDEKVGDDGVHDDDHDGDEDPDGDDDCGNDDPPDPVRDGIVYGTAGGDLIDAAYTGDNDGDRVDANDAILPGAAPQDDRIIAGAGNDTIRSGAGDDSVEGGSGNDSAEGGSGDDTIWGRGGDDTLLGDDGNDSLFGGDGKDSVRGGDGNDVIDTRGGGLLPLPDLGYPGFYASDAFPLNDLDSVYGGAGDDSITTGDDADLIYGDQGNDVIDAGIDADTVYAGLGNDTVIGAEGSDLIDGGTGNDLIYGGYGPGPADLVNIVDSLDLRPENGRDTISGGDGSDTIYGQDDDDVLDGGTGNDLIDGGIDEDTISGDAGQDTLLGGAGHDVISGGAEADIAYGGADRDTFLVASAAEGSGDQVYGGFEGNDFDTLDLSGVGRHRLVNVVTDSDGNGTDGTVEFLDGLGNITGSLNFTNIEEVIPCFTPGALIATPKGEVPVESLRAGDRIITRDNGIQPIRWVGQKTMSRAELAANPHLKPVLIRAGSLGNGLPERDMMVSPNHRMLVANDRTALYFDEHEVLVSAKHLITSAGVQTVDSFGTTYIHFMFDRHEVVLSNGAWTESFQPGDFTLKGMGNAQRSEIYDLFPDLKTEAGLQDYSAARRTLKRHEAMLLAR